MGLRKIIFSGLLGLLLFSSCDMVEDAGKRSVVYETINNTYNCTEVVIEDPDGNILAVIEPRSVRQIEISTSLFGQRDEMILYAHTPYQIMDSMLAGDTSVMPHGCNEWGMDTKKIRLRDGHETGEFRVRLRPPRYWDKPDNWLKESVKSQEAIKSFWKSQDVDLASEVPKTKVQLK